MHLFLLNATSIQDQINFFPISIDDTPYVQLPGKEVQAPFQDQYGRVESSYHSLKQKPRQKVTIAHQVPKKVTPAFYYSKDDTQNYCGYKENEKLCNRKKLALISCSFPCWGESLNQVFSSDNLEYLRINFAKMDGDGLMTLLADAIANRSPENPCDLELDLGCNGITTKGAIDIMNALVHETRPIYIRKLDLRHNNINPLDLGFRETLKKLMIKYKGSPFHQSFRNNKTDMAPLSAFHAKFPGELRDQFTLDLGKNDMSGYSINLKSGHLTFNCGVDADVFDDFCTALLALTFDKPIGSITTSCGATLNDSFFRIFERAKPSCVTLRASSPWAFGMLDRFLKSTAGAIGLSIHNVNFDGYYFKDFPSGSLKYLTLNNCGLTDPIVNTGYSDHAHFSYIEYLNIKNNRITDPTDLLKNCPKLRYLYADTVKLSYRIVDSYGSKHCMQVDRGGNYVNSFFADYRFTQVDQTLVDYYGNTIDAKNLIEALEKDGRFTRAQFRSSQINREYKIMCQMVNVFAKRFEGPTESLMDVNFSDDEIKKSDEWYSLSQCMEKPSNIERDTHYFVPV